MTAFEARQWAVEQAVLSFGTEGCANDSCMQSRIEMFLDMVSMQSRVRVGAAGSPVKEASE